jgi:hypothetical protein
LPGGSGKCELAWDRISSFSLPEAPVKRPGLLLVDALVNLALGGLLLVFPQGVIEALGIPGAASAFYPSVLGAVLLGIGIALLLEGRPARDGLGLRGAVAINLCGALALGGWSLLGDLRIPLRGRLVMGLLAVAIVALSLLEIRGARRARNSAP